MRDLFPSLASYTFTVYQFMFRSKTGSHCTKSNYELASFKNSYLVCKDSEKQINL